MRFFVASGVDEPDAWGLLPPTLPGGDPFAAAQLIDTTDLADVRVVFPIGRPGRPTPLTFFYWQAYVATHAGREGLQRLCRSNVWFSPACSAQGDELWVVRVGHLKDCIDLPGSKLDWHTTYPPRHPLAHLSGRIRSAYSLRLRRSAVENHDLFYLAEHPVALVVSERLLDGLRASGLNGAGAASYPAISLSDT